MKSRVSQITDLTGENPVDLSEVAAVDTMTCLASPSRLREKRVRQTMAIMKAARYQVGGETCEELAREWGCSYGVAKDICGEAWRRVQSQVLDRPGQQVYALERLRKISEDCIEEAEDAPPKERNFARKTAVGALGEILRFTSGINAVPVEWETLSVEEKWARVDEAERRIASVKATLPPRRLAAEDVDAEMAAIEREKSYENGRDDLSE